MSKWVKQFIVLSMIVVVSGCTGVDKRPVQPISSLASRRGQDGSNQMLKIPAEIIHQSGEGFVWVIKELLSPFNALRKGMVNAFGVTEESSVKEKSYPPSLKRYDSQ